MRRAAELLKLDNMTIKEVGYRVGYESDIAFTRVFKNFSGMTPRDYWRLKASAGDDPTRQLARLLSGSPAVVEGVAGRSYVWPALATLRPAEVTPEIEAEIDALLGVGQGASFARGAPWSGYSLAIREDGAWLWFTAGAG